NELDEAVVVARQVALERFLLIGGVDRDRADGLRFGAGLERARDDERGDDARETIRQGHERGAAAKNKPRKYCTTSGAATTVSPAVGATHDLAAICTSVQIACANSGHLQA